MSKQVPVTVEVTTAADASIVTVKAASVELSDFSFTVTLARNKCELLVFNPIDGKYYKFRPFSSSRTKD